MDNLVDTLINFVFPRRCVSCHTVSDFICDRCRELTVFPEGQLCVQCRRPSIGGFTHTICSRPFSADRLISLLKFEGPVKEAIERLKYGGVRDLADFLVDLGLEYTPEVAYLFGDQSLILPVPIYPLKKLERGFNQTELLSLALGKKLGLEVWLNFLIKKRDNPSQTKLDFEGRQANVSDAFGISGEDRRHRVLAGRDVIIVDDVLTSGATLQECAKVVKRNGARFVYLLSLTED